MLLSEIPFNVGAYYIYSGEHGVDPAEHCVCLSGVSLPPHLSQHLRGLLCGGADEVRAIYILITFDLL